MKIMSFTTQHCLNYLEQKIDFQVMADAVKQCGADIVGLQEMRDVGNRPDYAAQTKILSELTGLKYYYFAEAIRFDGGVNPYGNGLLSKYPIISAKSIPIPDPVEKTGTDLYETRCVLKAKLEGGITVLVTHFGLNHDEHENAMKVILENIEDKKCIVMGDFNMQPDNELFNPLIARMKDTAALFDGPRFSIPSDAPDRKIDYIFVSQDVEIVEADIPAIVASDHRPHTAMVNIQSRETML